MIGDIRIYSLERNTYKNKWDIELYLPISLSIDLETMVQDETQVYILCGTSIGQVWCISLKERRVISILYCHENSVQTIETIGEILLTGSNDGTYSLWNLYPDRCLWNSKECTKIGPICSSNVCYDNKKTIFSLGSEYGDIIFLTPQTRKVIKLMNSLHDDSIEDINIQEYRGRMLVATASLDCTIKIIETDTWTVIRTIDHPMGVTKVFFHSGLSFICTVCLDKIFRVWNLKGDIIACSDILPSIILSICVLPTCIWVSCDDGSLRCFALWQSQ